MTDIQDSKKPFYCIKIRTGETLITEVFSLTKEFVTMMNPFEVRTSMDDDGREMISAVPWIPFCDDENVTIPVAQMYYINYLNPKFTRFYGNILLQYKIASIKQEVAENMEDRNDYFTMMAGVDKIKKVAKEITEKFGINDEVDTEHFEEQAKKFKPVAH